MYKREWIKLLIDVYMIIVLLGILLWIPFPVVGHVIGATSIIHTFLLAVGDTTGWIRYLSLAWIPIFCLFLVGGYIIACKKKKYEPVILVVGIELLIAGIIIFSMVCIGNCYNLMVMLMGYAIRFLYFILMIISYAKVCKRKKDF